MTSPAELRSSYDAVVVGGRCAGSATALVLARLGLRVLIVERSRLGSDTLSTHALMRGGVLQLARWGLLDRIKEAGTPPVRRVSFHYADEIVDVPIKARDGVDGLYAPRRTVLDPLLAEAAGEAGAHLSFGPRLVDLMRGPDQRVSGVVIEDRDRRVSRIRAGIVIGADGIQSKVADLVKARPYRCGRHASGVVYGYWTGLDVEPGRYHWHYAAGVSAGVIPTNDGATCLFTSTTADRFHHETRKDLAAGYHRVLAAVSPALADAVGRAAPVGPLHGFAGQVGFYRQSWGPGWALVGDAGYFKDPITAHGITDALRDAELLGVAVVRGLDRDLAEYQSTRDRLSTAVFEVTDRIASYDWNLESVRDLHHDLSTGMSEEVTHLRALRPPPAVRAASGQRDGCLAGQPTRWSSTMPTACMKA